MNRLSHGTKISVGVVTLCCSLFTVTAFADPCGMVPPVYVGNNVPITRVGEQKTYVFFKDGIETVAIRPGFQGKVEEFGMLIPFPTVPALRKVSDNIFPHIAAAVDPPEVVIDLRIRFFALRGAAFAKNMRRKGAAQGLEIANEEKVRVVKEEAVGMYEVAVLEAGSSKALQRWMDDHGYKFPQGMDTACDDYVDAGWCFVAVKTKVGRKKGVEPAPGQRTVSAKLPAGSTFDGHVQAMGFRFKVDELVVPMRLSTFNKGDLHNIVYILNEEPSKIKSVPSEYVVRQIPGSQLFRNVTEPLPLRIIGGTVKDIPEFQRKTLPQRRNPVPHNGAARDLFAADLLAVKKDQLSHPHEETEKMLLQIGERLSLRGPAIDKLNEQSLEEKRTAVVAAALSDLSKLTMTVVDGNFPREILANQNLTFATYRMPARRNTVRSYDAKTGKPTPKQEGAVHFGKLSAIAQPALKQERSPAILMGSLLAFSCVALAGVVLMRQRTSR